VISPASVVILAGGRSTRLGHDKRLLQLTPGETLLEQTIRRVREVSDDVVVAVGTDGTGFTNLPARIILDARPGVGPAGGILAGLRAVHHEYALVVACDLPFLSVRVLQALLAMPRDYDLLVPRRADGRLEMLHAVYRCSCARVLERRLAAGQYRLAGLVEEVATRFIDEAILRRYDPDLHSFENLNTPADLARTLALLNRPHSAPAPGAGGAPPGKGEQGVKEQI